ncbi:MAG: hypothetical protein JKY10_04645 [Cohaesibacteraceae bacterium]|nr:hypothetical protein [Cohaesibacteraceae bacterium]
MVLKFLQAYFLNILIALDQLLNTVLGGDPDETISSRCSKNRHKWYWKPLACILEKIDPGHLGRSQEDDEGSDASL